MPLHAIESSSLGDQVFKQLSAEIILGHYVPGSWLPPERALTDIFKVNRHVVREALKRLAQVGLVKVSPGGGSQVMDFKRHAGLDLLVLMAEHARGGPDVADTWLSVLEMRAVLAADAARLCARRASAELRAELLEIARQTLDSADDAQTYALEVRFWELVLQGADNIAYRLAFNTMLKGTRAMAEIGRRWAIEDARRNGSRLTIAKAIQSGDEAAAERVTIEAMRVGLELFATPGKSAPPARLPPARPTSTKAPARAARAKGAAGSGPRGSKPRPARKTSK
jgi:GntR family transcriptional regulator, transcriptional repressor for pyruvate dehydrogenase complex